MDRFDALVLGAGPAGTSAAYFLSRAGWKVAIVERTPFPRRKVCGEFISPETHPILKEMGIDLERQSCGPSVSRVGLFARDQALEAPMPLAHRWGKAVERSWLDLAMLEAAESAGAHVFQPYRADSVLELPEECRCSLASRSEQREIAAKIVIAAHGSWFPGSLATQPVREKHPHDLLGFKFVFENSKLEPDLMPLIAFPGGYGGLAHGGKSRVGLSCCVRRDVLQSKRLQMQGRTAAEAVLSHIRSSINAVHELLVDATEPEERLAAGPIHPGIRIRPLARTFLVGNAAGEAHPVIAEGISMAIQGGHLLASVLSESHPSSAHEQGARYAQAWRKAFSNRILVAKMVAGLAMSETGARLMLTSVKLLPQLLTAGAALSGKGVVKPLPLLSESRS